MKEISGYLHLYIMCECECDTRMADGSYIPYGKQRLTANLLAKVEGGFVRINKLFLRPLSSMTEEEAKQCYKIDPYSKGEWLIKSIYVKENIKGYEPNIVQINWEGKEGSTGYACGTEYMYFNRLSSEQHKFLLSKHFDLFQLIESGLAIASPHQSKTISNE